MTDTRVDAVQDDRGDAGRGDRRSGRAVLDAGVVAATAASGLAPAAAVDLQPADHGNAAIWADWIALWNGDLSRAAHIIAPHITLHLTPIGGGPLAPLESPAGMAQWIGGLHQAIVPFTFVEQMAPLFQQDMIAGRWCATGRYAGGLPGATAQPGAPIAFAGADFLRIEDGKIAEYWLSADVLDLMGQLGMLG